MCIGLAQELRWALRDNYCGSDGRPVLCFLLIICSGTYAAVVGKTPRYTTRDEVASSMVVVLAVLHGFLRCI